MRRTLRASTFASEPSTVVAAPSSGMWGRCGVIALTLLALGGCDLLFGDDVPADGEGQVEEPAQPSESAAVQAARTALKSGDFAAASRAYNGLSDEELTLEVRNELAYVTMIEGRAGPASADVQMFQMESDPAFASDAASRRLRIALVRLLDASQTASLGQKNDKLDKLVPILESVDHPLSKLLLAEIAMSKLELTDQGRADLKSVAEGGSEYARIAADYLALMSGDMDGEGLASAQALWALSNRVDSVPQAASTLQSMSAEGKADASQVLMWAGRAAASGDATSAEDLLALLDEAPVNQAWRVEATRALMDVAVGEYTSANARFEKLEAGEAPKDGVADARATAVSLLEPDSPDAADNARMLAGPWATDAIASALLLHLDVSEALTHAPVDSSLRRTLETP